MRVDMRSGRGLRSRWRLQLIRAERAVVDSVPCGLALPVSDSGSETGAASLMHMRSNAVNLAMHNALTSTYIPNQVHYSNVCAVRDEEAAGSNPATPTSSQAIPALRYRLSHRGE